MTGQALNAEHKDRLSHSRITHISVDPSVPKTQNSPAQDEENGGGGENEESDPDRVITNARDATDADGLLDDGELTALFTQGHRLLSAYDVGLSKIQTSDIALYGDRIPLQRTQPGFHEPSYSSYTYYWQSVLGVPFRSHSVSIDI